MQGTLLDNRYQVGKKLGAGGMAVVFHGKDLIGRGDVAIKVMPPSGASVNEFVRRFKREFDVCSRLDHPNIIKLLSCGRTPDGSYYYAMEYLACPTLEDVLKERKKLRPAMALQVVLQMARAFEHYFEKDVVHRDLKPGNIMVEDNGRVVVMDFGLVHDPSMTQLTATGTIMGTPQYMSPELLLGEKVDQRSDIFQLGIIAHECLCGEKAFTGKTVPEVGAKIMYGHYTPVKEVDPTVSDSWNNFLLNCLGTAREDRYQNAKDVLADLQKIMLSQPVERKFDRQDKATEELTLGDNGALTTSQPGRPRRNPLTGDTDPLQYKAHGKDQIRGDTLVERQARRRQRKLQSTNPAFSSGMSHSGISADTVPPESLHSQRKVIVAILGLLIMAIIGGVVVTTFMSESYTIEELKAVADIDRITVKWKSPSPYQSQVELLGKQPKMFYSRDGGPQKEHEVVITGLEQEKQYEYRIVFPSGERSLPNTCKTGHFELEITSVEKKGRGVQLAWKSQPPGKARLWVKREKRGRVGFEAQNSTDGVRYVLLEDLSRDTSELVVETSLPSGATVTSPMSDLLRKQIDKHCAVMSSLNPSKFIADTTESLQGTAASHLTRTLLTKGPDETEAEFQKRKKAYLQQQNLKRDKTRNVARELIESRLEESPYLEDYKKARAVSPLVFRTKIVPFSVRKKLYNQLCQMITIYLYTCFEKVPARNLEPLPELGDFGIGKRGMVGRVEQRILFRRKPRGKKLNIGLPLPWEKKSPEWKSKFTLVNPETITDAELVLYVDDWDDVAMWVTFNKTFMALTYNRPIFVWPKRAPQMVVQRIPLPVLKNGENTIKFRVDTLGGRVTRDDVDLNAVFIRFRRKKN